MISYVELVGLLLGSNLINAMVTAWLSRRKSAAEVTKISADAEVSISSAWRELLGPYQHQTDFLRAELESQRRELERLMTENSNVKAELRDTKDTLLAENVSLRTELRLAREEIGILQRREREALQKAAETNTALVMTLRNNGMDIPEGTIMTQAPNERTRSSDLHRNDI